jgi:hypothetical protein
MDTEKKPQSEDEKPAEKKPETEEEKPAQTVADTVGDLVVSAVTVLVTPAHAN